MTATAVADAPVDTPVADAPVDMPPDAPEVSERIADLDAEQALAKLEAALDVTVEQAALARTLPLMQRGTAARTLLPILQNALLVAEEGPSGGVLPDGVLRLTTTDLSAGITTTMQAAVTRPGALTVPWRLLSEFAGKLAGGPLRLVGDEAKLTATCGRARATFHTLPADEFPSLPAVNGPTWDMPGAALRQIVQSVLPAAATDDSRPIMLAVCLRLTPGEPLSAEAADGFRLSVLREIAGTTAPDLERPLDVLVQAKELGSIAGRLLGTKQDEATLTCGLVQGRDDPSPRHLALTLPGAADNSHGPVTVYIRCAEGQWMDLKRVVPQHPPVTLRVKRADLHSLTKRLMLFARDAANLMRFDVDESGDEPVLAGSAAASETGSGSDAIPVDVERHGDAVTAGQRIKVSLSGPYLDDACGAATGDVLVLGYSGPLSPVLVTCPTAPGWLHVIMPMHTVD